MGGAADILERAADLIEPQGAWTQGEYARDAHGRGCEPDSPAAVSWCAYGAAKRIAGERGSNALGKATQFTMGSFNDTPGRTQAEVVAKIREAAAKARGEQP